jgi:hypothetical protein
LDSRAMDKEEEDSNSCATHKGYSRKLSRVSWLAKEGIQYLIRRMEFLERIRCKFLRIIGRQSLYLLQHLTFHSPWRNQKQGQLSSQVEK